MPYSPIPPARRALLRLLAAAALSVLSAVPARADPQAALAALREPGTVVLMRHARAPGVGDPPGFKLGDCSTQRNLNDEGRADARAAGQRLRAAGVQVGKLLSSPWCRCLETARLLDLGPVVAEPAFSSTFRSEAGSDEITAAARRVIDGWRGPGVLLAVTHQVNIQALTGRSTSSGEMIVLRRQADGSLREVGALE